MRQPNSMSGHLKNGAGRSAGAARPRRSMRIPRLAALAVETILTLPASSMLPATTAAGQTGGLMSAEHIITALYAYPGISTWNLVTGNAPVIGASIVDMCAADGYGSSSDGTPCKR